MKRVAVLIGMAAVAPSVAQAQIPAAPAATPAAPAPVAPAAPPAATAPSSAPVAPAAPPAPAPPAPAPAEAAKAPPGDEYFVEQPPAAAPAPAATEPAVFEPPPPGALSSFEPPPPPETRHQAPNNALWLGARVGWLFPFGNLWAVAEPVATSGGTGYVLRGVPWRDYASSGPMFELNAGMRLSRSSAPAIATTASTARKTAPKATSGRSVCALRPTPIASAS
jgi:hypothetical protein